MKHCIIAKPTAFQDYLEENINLNLTLKTEEDIESAVWDTTNLFQTAAWISTPHMKVSLQKLGYSLEIHGKIAEKRRMRRQWHNNRNAHDKRLLNKAQK